MGAAMAGLEYGTVLWLSASKAALPGRLWHMSIMWKHDCTLEGERGRERFLVGLGVAGEKKRMIILSQCQQQS